MLKDDLPSLFSEQLRQMLDVSPDTWIIIRSTGNIVAASRSAEGLLGYAENELTGRPFNTLLPERSVEEHNEFLKDFFLNPFAWRMGRAICQVCMIKKDGAGLNAELGFQVVVTDEGLWAIVSI
jgi:PAS domain S-box-containing protein